MVIHRHLTRCFDENIRICVNILNMSFRKKKKSGSRSDIIIDNNSFKPDVLLLLLIFTCSMFIYTKSNVFGQNNASGGRWGGVPVRS